MSDYPNRHQNGDSINNSLQFNVNEQNFDIFVHRENLHGRAQLQGNEVKFRTFIGTLRNSDFM